MRPLLLLLAVSLASLASTAAVAGESHLASPVQGRSFDLQFEARPGRPVAPKAAGHEKDPDGRLRFAGSLAILSTPVGDLGGGAPRTASMIWPVTIKPKGRNAVIEGRLEIMAGMHMDLHVEVVGTKIAGTITDPNGKTTFAGKEGEPDLPGDEQLARARDLELRREPKRAAALYASIVEERRYEPWFSAPALIGWWECHRALHGDAKAERDFAERAARWLTQPPPLTADPPSLETATADLLWKAWVPTLPGAAPAPDADTAWRPAFTVAQVDRQNSTWEGKTTTSLQLRVEAPIEPGMQLVTDRPNVGKDPAIEVVMVVGDQRIAPQYASQNCFAGKLSLSLTFPEPPRGTEQVALAGTVTLRQPAERTVTRVPLRLGAAWKTDAGEAKITACEVGEGGCTVSYEVHGEGGGSSASSSSSTSGGGGIAMLDEHAPCRVVGSEGLAVAPNSSSIQGSGAVTKATLRFATPFVPTELLIAANGALSSRTVPVAIAAVDLP